MFKSKSLVMLGTGIVLALVLWGIMQAVQNSSSRTSSQEDVNKTKSPITEPISGQYENAPASILSAVQNGNTIRLAGTGVSGAGITLQNGETAIVRTKVSGTGNWQFDFSLTNTIKPISYDLLMVTPDGHQIRSDQSLFVIGNPHIPETTLPEIQMPDTQEDGQKIGKALLLLTAPGANSRVLQTAYTELPNKDGFALEAIDYDNSGGVIFSGTSVSPGKVLIYAGDNLVGESHVDNTGRWSLIFGNILPLGEYKISAELVMPDDTVARLTLPFERMKPLFAAENSPKILAEHLDDRIQIGRALFGGGYQYTVIYAPIALED